MSKVPKLIFDDYILSSFEIKTKEIDSMTNDKYKSNVEKVRKIIERNNKKYAEAEARASKILIKSFDANTSFKNSQVIAQIQKIACEVKEKDVNELIITRVLDAAIDELKEEDFFAHSLDINDLNKSQSHKIYNIKFNIKYCFEMISDAYCIGKSCVDKNYFSLVLSILSLIKKLNNVTTISLTYLEALVVAIIAKQRKNIEEENLINLVLNDENLKYCGCKVDSLKISNTLTNLSKMRIISIVDGKIELIESIIV